MKKENKTALPGSQETAGVLEKEINFREKLAELEHIQWQHWTNYMLNNLSEGNFERWEKQIKTPYSELSEKEKDSDREWADKVLKIFKEKVQNAQRRLKEFLEDKQEPNKLQITLSGWDRERNWHLIKTEIDKIFKEEFGDKLI